MYPYETGTIKIDGIDIASIKLEELRKNLIIVPQECLLFVGTLRSNLDPFNEYQDYEIWDALEKVNLKDKIESMEHQLLEPVVESMFALVFLTTYSPQMEVI